MSLNEGDFSRGMRFISMPTRGRGRPVVTADYMPHEGATSVPFPVCADGVRGIDNRRPHVTRKERPGPQTSVLGEWACKLWKTTPGRRQAIFRSVSMATFNGNHGDFGQLETIQRCPCSFRRESNKAVSGLGTGSTVLAVTKCRYTVC